MTLDLDEEKVEIPRGMSADRLDVLEGMAKFLPGGQEIAELIAEVRRLSGELVDTEKARRHALTAAEHKITLVLDDSYGAAECYGVSGVCLNCSTEVVIKRPRGSETRYRTECPACGCWSVMSRLQYVAPDVLAREAKEPS